MAEPTTGDSPADREQQGLAAFLFGHSATDDDAVVHTTDRSLTLGELKTQSRLAARALLECGVTPGEAVCCIVESGDTALASMFGAWLTGAVYVPINGRLTPFEISHQVRSVGAAVVIGDTIDIPDVVTNRIHPGSDSAWRVSVSPSPTDARRYGPDVALVMRTSGTTGDSKPIELAHDGVRDGIDTVLASLRSRSKPATGERPAPMPNLIPTGLALWSGLWNALFALRAGAPVVLLDRFSPGDFARLIQQHQIRSTVLAPAMMSALVDDIEVEDLAPLTMVRSITAPLTPHQARAFTAKFGVGVTNCYGQTELGSEVVGWSPSDLREFGEAKLGAVGRAHHDIEIKILGDSGEELPDGETGEIWIRSPFLSPSSEVASRVVDGFLRTGDLGRLDEDGFLWLEGRLSDVINRGGLKVLPQEVEEALRELPGVADACVAGVPDPRLGEVPMAWVTAGAGRQLDPATLVESLRDRLAGYKMPIGVEVVDDFPRNEVGKVLRRDLIAAWSAT